MLPLDDQLGFNLHRVSLIFRRELIRALKEYNLTPEQWQLLAGLWIKGSLSQKEIVDLTLQDAPSVSRMVTRMERNGLVRIESSGEDRRLKRVEATPEGKALREILPERLRKHFAALLKGFPERKRNSLQNLLRELRIVLHDL